MLLQEYMENLLKKDYVIKLIEKGGPNAGKHTINRENGKKWINAQLSNGIKLSCETLLNTVRYIPHSELFEKL